VTAMDKCDDCLYTLAEQVWEESKEGPAVEPGEWDTDPDMEEYPF